MMENNDSIGVIDCWKNYNIAECIKDIEDSLNELSLSTIHACWNKLWKEVVQDPNCLPDIGIETIIQISHDIGGEGFQDIAALRLKSS